MLKLPELPEKLSRTQIADLAGVSRRTVANWEQRGLLTPAYRQGRVIRYYSSSVLALLFGVNPTGADQTLPAEVNMAEDGSGR